MYENHELKGTTISTKILNIIGNEVHLEPIKDLDTSIGYLDSGVVDIYYLKIGDVVTISIDNNEIYYKGNKVGKLKNKVEGAGI